jgi:hypothetical protein
VDPPGDGLFDRNPIQRFSDRAADYVRYRPTYPAVAIRAVLDGTANVFFGDRQVGGLRPCLLEEFGVGQGGQSTTGLIFIGLYRRGERRHFFRR